MGKYDVYGQPIRVGGITLKNRFAVAPVTTGDAYGPDGGYTEAFAVYMARRAQGGFGLVIPGAVTTDIKVDPFSALGSAPLSHPEAWVAGAKRLTDKVHAAGARIFCQLTFGLGRNYEGLPAPSADVVFGTTDKLSPVLTVEQIKLKEEQFIESAKLAKQAGYDGIEVHAMHWGYLLDQFGTSLFNRRTDQYGGSLENRTRIDKELVEGIHQACGADYPVGMRLGLKSFIKGVNQASLTGEPEAGRTIEEGVAIARLLEQYGYDMLDVDTGMYDSFYYACPPMYLPQGFMIELAAKAKAAVSIPVFAGGRMQDYDQGARAIAEGKIDGVALGRPALADPDYPNKVLSGQVEKIRPCLGCNVGCFNRLMAEGQPASCAVNPEANRETTHGLRPGQGQKKVAVIGGGVAGMEAARTAALRGYTVELYEQSDHLGGHLVEGGAHPFKGEVARLNQWFQRELQELKVPVHLNHEVTAAEAAGWQADAVIVATGSTTAHPPIPGLDQAVSALDAIAAPERLGHTVVIAGGGLVGCELALDCAKNGHAVTVVEALDKLMNAGGAAPLPNAMMMKDLFAHYGVTVLLEHKLTEVKAGAVVVSGKDGTREIPADTVVSALGFKPVNTLGEALKNSGAAVFVVGDASDPATIKAAIWQAYDAANSI